MSDLPPLDQQQAYVVVGSNEQVGPYTLELLISEVVAGRLADTTPVWWPPLADWTTMAIHPGVAGEIARRRAAVGTAPAWAAPGTGQPSEQVSAFPSQATDPFAPPAATDPFAPPAATESPSEPADAFTGPTDNSGTSASTPTGVEVTGMAEAAPSPTVSDEPAEVNAQGIDDSATVETTNGSIFSTPSSFGDPESPLGNGPSAPSGIVEAEIVDAEIVERDAIEGDTSVGEAANGPVDDAVRATFNALVERSTRRAGAIAKVEAADETFVGEVIAAATALGFGIDDRTDVDRRHELRFGEQSGNLLVISLGQITADDPERIRAAALPVTVSYRSDSAAQVAGSQSSTAGHHGEILVTPDEWTGQTTASVSLFLAVDDYLADDLTLIGDGLARDVSAIIAVVKARLS